MFTLLSLGCAAFLLIGLLQAVNSLRCSRRCADFLGANADDHCRRKCQLHRNPCRMRLQAADRDRFPASSYGRITTQFFGGIYQDPTDTSSDRSSRSNPRSLRVFDTYPEWVLPDAIRNARCIRHDRYRRDRWPVKPWRIKYGWKVGRQTSR